MALYSAPAEGRAQELWGAGGRVLRVERTCGTMLLLNVRLANYKILAHSCKPHESLNVDQKRMKKAVTCHECE